ncbi:SgcJ/EcaC family oxidoreductase [Spirulina sp. 06S082]|uniref:SgcJ/EcaC family oxidoreductase n=1 Tax=Spirulina sp. 06S082 TaxID=3110248 RepID=UPI002B1F318C|nr:SgcJ/EcaC family oxidoreductase [Spirulina sp. 06S082]MEA5467520.1 SgcJ/EcaC family oxidoreductase [Spirulina sp. 06S082]
MNSERGDAIAAAAEACREKDAVGFASLFTFDGELVLAGGQKFKGQEAIARVTAAYFATCEEIGIEIEDIRYDGDRAVIEWFWYSRDRSTGKSKRRENTIVLHFQGKAIASWRES